jgi:hypothetical protein
MTGSCRHIHSFHKHAYAAHLSNASQLSHALLCLLFAMHTCSLHTALQVLDESCSTVLRLVQCLVASVKQALDLSLKPTGGGDMQKRLRGG